MVFEKLTQLTRYLLSQQLCAQENLDSWAESVKLELRARQQGNGLVLCEVHYTAQFEVDRVTTNPVYWFAHIVTWLYENDPDRDVNQLDDPEIEVEPTENQAVSISFEVEFYEPVTLVEDDNGEFELSGTRYRIDTPVMDVADSAAIGTDDTQATDAPYTRPN
ncbi:phage tail protein [Marinibactrum halimedae]|uniref:Phage tail protein n=1 Tax=Marinibactrum halimedae TaxID=1444977 RepID=A0AA37T7K9_9GAMM|nr:phage tail protein [Marinibactrum halimedae]MCD9458465.1 phage tail protein [Marinibactrum halimedae]GLS26162.1 hypothetical protein GCM10007877_18770 [Marinibactrum halimedae]